MLILFIFSDWLLWDEEEGKGEESGREEEEEWEEIKGKEGEEDDEREDEEEDDDEEEDGRQGEEVWCDRIEGGRVRVLVRADSICDTILSRDKLFSFSFSDISMTTRPKNKIKLKKIKLNWELGEVKREVQR